MVWRGGMFFFFSSRRRHTRLQGDWSSDVCSSDLDRPTGCSYLVLLLGGVAAVDQDGLPGDPPAVADQVADEGHRSEEHTSELQSPCNLVCRLLLEKKKPIRSAVRRCEDSGHARSVSV